MYSNFRNLVQNWGVDISDAVKITSYNQSRLFNLDHLGEIKAGRKADILLLDKNLSVCKIIKNGIEVPGTVSKVCPAPVYQLCKICKYINISGRSTLSLPPFMGNAYLCVVKVSIMESLKELFRIGKGPSSSHTIAPQRSTRRFLEMVSDPASFEVTLYGSLAATGKGHMTDVAIQEVLEPVAPVSIVWQSDIFLPFHPNGMRFTAKDGDGKVMKDWTVYSVGESHLRREGR